MPLLLIGFGLFIKTTSLENFNDAKRWWKFLVITGSIILLLRTINLLMFG